MGLLSQNIYCRSPVCVQNIMVSAYGAHLRHRRYGGCHQEWLEMLQRTERYSDEEILRWRADKLRELLAYAFRHVPYYREIAEKRKLTVSDFGSITDLHKLPLVEKEMIRKEPDRFSSEAVRKKDTFVLKTSGTTGTPLEFRCDNESRQKHYAFWSRLRGWYGLGPLPRRASFFGRVVVPRGQDGPPFWRRDMVQNVCVFSSYHMSPKNLADYYRQIESFRPREFLGYASCLFAMAKYMKQQRLRWSEPPRVVFSTAETLWPHYRELIEEQFETVVNDQYGCTEMAVFISQCEAGTYHVHPEHGIVEVVNEDGLPLAEGEPGEAVCTSFVCTATPLIRYRLGDRMAISSDRCECGRPFPVVKALLGRMDDTLIAPDGTPIGRLSPVFKGIPGLHETQVVQTAADAVEMRVVVDSEFTADSKAKLLRQMLDRTRNLFAVTVRKVPEIPRGNGGKVRNVIAFDRNSESTERYE